MSKRPKFDEAGDSDELQALFDSIAADPVGGADSLNPSRAAAPVLPIDDSGDTDELQALFDAVSEQSGQVGAQPTSSAAEPAAAAPEADAVFNRLGQLTRQVHDSLRELGLEGALKEAAEAIPDARQRLGYIAQTTEQAASRVLNATDVARPIQDELASGADALSSRWDELYAGKLSPEAFRELSADTRSFLGAVADGSRVTNAQLMEIMMAQDFQDLTGQVIKKLMDVIREMETQLLQLLVDNAPIEKRQDVSSSLLNGPQTKLGNPDAINDQGQVDDLLANLGF